jgi:DNA-binding MarR family transcriptional regulator
METVDQDQTKLMPRQTEDPLLFRFFTEVGIIEQLARATLERALPDDLKMSQFIVLNHLVRLGGDWSPARLANAFQVTKGAITNSLQRLESRGLVKVVPDPNDGRGKLVSLTVKGRSKRDQCVRSIEPLLAELQKTFGEQRFAEVLPVLEEVRRYLDERRA